MDPINKDNIIIYLSTYFNIQEVREHRNKLVVTGHLKGNATPQEIVNNSQGKIYSIKLKSKDERDQFFIFLTEERKKLNIHLTLFALTVITTMFAGARLEGVNPATTPFGILRGLPYSFTLLMILGVHELGHYIFAKKHSVDATLPYFIPVPTLIGTFGAVIKMRSRVRKRNSMIEIGAAGPIAGFLVALPALIIGFYTADIVPISEGEGIQLGESIITKLVTIILYPDLADNMQLSLNSVGFAAWIGMFVTMLNLIPVGQLDGGHILYAVFEKQHFNIARLCFAAILLLGIVPLFFDHLSLNWLVWAVLIFFLIKVKHPPSITDRQALSLKDKIVAIIALIIFIITFIPIPIII